MQTPEARLMGAMLGAVRTQALRTAMDLGIAGLLADRPRSAAELAAACSCDPVAMDRLLSALAADEVLAESPDGAYALTPVGECLRPSAQGGIGEYAEFICTRVVQPAAHLTAAIRGGRGGSAFEAAEGQPFFRYLAQNPGASVQFDTAMQVSVDGLRDALAARDWQHVRTVADVGGGTGAVLAGLLRQHPHLTGTLCERPGVLAGAQPVLTEAGVDGRCELLPCDFFTEIPPGRDVYLLVRVLHDWDDTSVSRILGAVRAAMRSGSRLYVADLLLPDSAEEEGAAWRRTYDLFINLLVPGHERTAREWRELLARSGFRIERTADAGWRGSLLECVPEPDGTCRPQAESVVPAQYVQQPLRPMGDVHVRSPGRAEHPVRRHGGEP